MQVVEEFTQPLQGEVHPTQIWLTESMNMLGSQVVTQLLLELRKYVLVLHVKQWLVDPLHVLQLFVQAWQVPETPVEPEEQVATQLVP